MGKFHQFLTVICRQHAYIFVSRRQFSKCQWIFTKLGTCIDIVEILFGIANGQVLSICDSCLSVTQQHFRFRTMTRINLGGFSPNLICALILWIGIAILSFFDRVISS